MDQLQNTKNLLRDLLEVLKAQSGTRGLILALPRCRPKHTRTTPDKATLQTAGLQLHPINKSSYCDVSTPLNPLQLLHTT